MTLIIGYLCWCFLQREFRVKLLLSYKNKFVVLFISFYSKCFLYSLCILTIEGFLFQDPDCVCYDLKYALRLCLELNHKEACVHIYSVMGLYEEAVELALTVRCLSLSLPSIFYIEIKKKLYIKCIGLKLDTKELFFFFNNFTIQNYFQSKGNKNESSHMNFFKKMMKRNYLFIHLRLKLVMVYFQILNIISSDITWFKQE